MKREILYRLKSKNSISRLFITVPPVLPMILVPNIPKKSKIE